MTEYDYSVDIINALLNKGVITEELYEKCQPEYISSLPGSLRSNDVDELQSRLDVIDEQIKEVDAEIEDEEDWQKEFLARTKELHDENTELQKNLDDYHKKEDDFEKESERLQGEALDDASEIRDTWDEFYNDNPNELPSLNGLLANGNEDRLNMLMKMFGTDEFEFKGFLYGEEADFIRTLADDIDIVAGSFDSNFNDATDDWMALGGGLADDMRSFADKYDINKNPLGDDLQDIMNTASKGLPSEWENKIAENNKAINDYNAMFDDSISIQQKAETKKGNLEDNRAKTQDRLDEVKKKQNQ